MQNRIDEKYKKNSQPTKLFDRRTSIATWCDSMCVSSKVILNIVILNRNTITTEMNPHINEKDFRKPIFK